MHRRWEHSDCIAGTLFRWLDNFLEPNEMVQLWMTHNLTHDYNTTSRGCMSSSMGICWGGYSQVDSEYRAIKCYCKYCPESMCKIYWTPYSYSLDSVQKYLTSISIYIHLHTHNRSLQWLYMVAIGNNMAPSNSIQTVTVLSKYRHWSHTSIISLM